MLKICRIFIYLFLLSNLQTHTLHAVSIFDDRPVVRLGHYQLHGEKTDGSSYQGYVTISTHGQNYLVEWKIGIDKNQLPTQTQIGTGVLVGRTLCVTYYTQGSRNPSHGVAGFYVNADGILEGAWCGHMHKCYGKETLYFVAPL